MTAGPFRDNYLVFDREDNQLAAVKAQVWRDASSTSAPNGEQYNYVCLCEKSVAAVAALIDKTNRLLLRAGDPTEQYRVVDAIPHDTLPHIELFLMVQRNG